jgi:hypothetical protein
LERLKVTDEYPDLTLIFVVFCPTTYPLAGRRLYRGDIKIKNNARKKQREGKGTSGESEERVLKGRMRGGTNEADERRRTGERRKEKGEGRRRRRRRSVKSQRRRAEGKRHGGRDER